MLEKLRAAGVRMADPVAPVLPDGPLTGKTIVLTGTFPTLSREEATRLAEGAGAKVTQTVSKKTSFVDAGTEPGTKLARAIELGVEVIDEAELQRRSSPVRRHRDKLGHESPKTVTQMPHSCEGAVS